MRAKNFKNYILILAIVNFRNYWYLTPFNFAIYLFTYRYSKSAVHNLSIGGVLVVGLHTQGLHLDQQ